MKKYIYIYPPYSGTKKNPGNPYSKLLHESFQKNDSYYVIGGKQQKHELWKLFIRLNADIYFFSWIESMTAGGIWGKVKFVYFIIFMLILRILQKKVIWILHNKHPHKKKTKITDCAMWLLAHLSTNIITHAQEGVEFATNCLGVKESKCHYIPHPVYTSELFPSSTPKWDYVIWGEVMKRKNILEFIHFFNSHPFFNDKKLLICGRCKNKEYAHAIEKQIGDNITFYNRFIPDEELTTLIGMSRIILFTYHSSSILSSGALIYSLNFCKPIIGPKTGSFAELNGIVKCYTSFSNIPYILCDDYNNKYTIDYIRKNTWSSFPQKVLSIL